MHEPHTATVAPRPQGTRNGVGNRWPNDCECRAAASGCQNWRWQLMAQRLQLSHRGLRVQEMALATDGPMTATVAPRPQGARTGVGN